MKIRLTQKRVSRLKPGQKDYLAWDDGTPRFCVRVRVGGAKRYMHIRTDPRTGKQKTTTIGDPELMLIEDARKRAEGLNSEIAANQAVAVGQPQETVEAPLAPLFRDYARKVWMPDTAQYYKPATQARNRMALDKQLIPAFGRMRLDEITKPVILRWFNRYSGAAPGGANRTLEILGVVLNHAVKAGLIKRNPAYSIPMNPKPKGTRFLSDEERARLLDALDGVPCHNVQNADLVRLLLFTGCRAGEIRDLRWSEVGEDKINLEDSKTGPRTVWLSPEALAVLEARRRWQKEQGMISPFVFPNPCDPGRSIQSTTWFWHRLRERIGLADVRLHDLRHSFATQAIRQGIPLPVVSKLLGHKRLEMTLRYTHVSDAEVEAAAERVGVRIGGLLGENKI